MPPQPGLVNLDFLYRYRLWPQTLQFLLEFSKLVVVQTNKLVNLLCLFAQLSVSLSLSVGFLLIHATFSSSVTDGWMDLHGATSRTNMLTSCVYTPTHLDKIYDVRSILLLCYYHDILYYYRITTILLLYYYYYYYYYYCYTITHVGGG